jgi:hypothetical protein
VQHQQAICSILILLADHAYLKRIQPQQIPQHQQVICSSKCTPTHIYI